MGVDDISITPNSIFSILSNFSFVIDTAFVQLYILFTTMTMFKHLPWRSSAAKPPIEGEESLTSILDVNQRSELTLLIASATASMRKTVESNFDASVSSPHRIGLNSLLIYPGYALS